MTAVFIAMGFHLEHTHSTHFLIDILKEIYPDLHIVTDGDAWRKVPILKPDKLFIFQVIFSPKEIDSWGAKDVVFFPMYDACPHTEEFWNQYKNYKIFSFSKTLYDFLSVRGFNTFYSQYFIKPDFQTKNFLNPSVFFWERSEKINWQVAKNLITPDRCFALHYHYSTRIRNKNEERPSENDIKNYNITFSDWFSDQDEYKAILNNTTIYIAPRESEGIGMSFLEAMAKGCIVLAYDAPTMNEYIQHGITGYLFDEKTSESLDLTPDKLGQLSIATKKIVEDGYKKWINSIPEIKTFFQSNAASYKPHFYFGTWLYHILFAQYIYYKLKIIAFLNKKRRNA